MRVVLLSLVLGLSAPAHSDLSKTIAALSAKINERPSAELYFQRALEYRALREKHHTVEDLRRALKLDPGFQEAKFALAEELGKSDEALRLAIQLANGPGKIETTYRASLLLIRVHRLSEENQEALQLCRRLAEKSENLRQDDSELDLLHAEILLDLKRPTEAATVLRAAWRRTKSIVARNNWIDAALTAGQTEETLPLIEHELRTSRLRSSWLIRRARALLVLKQAKAARADLHSALLEINSRLNPRQPDLTLVSDRGLIHALMGNPGLAKRDLATLQKSLLPQSSYRLLNDQLDGSR